MISKMTSVSVYVRDSARAVEFWTQKVGFQLRNRHSMGPGAEWIEVSPLTGETILVLYPQSLMPDWKQRKPSIIFWTENIRETYNEMLARGVNFRGPPQAMSWGTFATFEDDEGNEFTLKGSVE